MNLVIDQGNSSLKCALFNGDDIVKIGVFANDAHDELLNYLSLLQFEGVIYSSVSGYNNSLLDLFAKQDKRLILLDYKTRLPIKIDYSTPNTLGVDRIAGAVGAWLLNGETTTLIIDAGTAITYDLLTSDGVYRGGNIAPGISTRFKSLNHYTKKLPLIEPSLQYPELGFDTNSAILSGVMSGVVYECEGYIAKIYKKEPQMRVIFTGGDHKLLYNQLKNSTFVPLIDEEHLVLKGLNAILRYNVEK